MNLDPEKRLKRVGQLYLGGGNQIIAIWNKIMNI
jgi:hypothetical protein